MAAILTVLRNVEVYCAMSEVTVDTYKLNFDSIAQCLNVLRNVDAYCAISGVDPYEVNPNTLHFSLGHDPVRC